MCSGSYGEYSGEPDIVTDPKGLRMEMNNKIGISESDFFVYILKTVLGRSSKDSLTVKF